MYSSSSSSSSYSSSSNSNSPPTQMPNQMFYVSSGDQITTDFGYGTIHPQDVDVNHQMNSYQFQRDDNQLLTPKTEKVEYTGDQFLSHPTTQQFEQFVPVGGIHGNNDAVFGGQENFQQFGYFNIPHGVCSPNAGFFDQNAFVDITNQQVHQNYDVSNTGFNYLPMQMQMELSSIAEAPQVKPKRRRAPKEEIKKVSSAMHQNSFCSNCGCRETKLWRRDINGFPECNACNLYERMNKTKRPQHLWNKVSGKRTRRPVVRVVQDNEMENEEDDDKQY